MTSASDLPKTLVFYKTAALKSNAADDAVFAAAKDDSKERKIISWYAMSVDTA